jgi:hypothetical protein
MKKEAPENEASHFSHGLHKAVFLFALKDCWAGLHIRPDAAV